MDAVAFVQLVHLNEGKKTGFLVTLQQTTKGNNADSSLLPLTSGITSSDFRETWQNAARGARRQSRGPSQSRRVTLDHDAPASVSALPSPCSYQHSHHTERHSIHAVNFKRLSLKGLPELCQPQGRCCKRLQHFHLMGFPTRTPPLRGAAIAAQGPVAMHGAQVAAVREVWGVLVLSTTDYTNSWTSQSSQHKERAIFTN